VKNSLREMRFTTAQDAALGARHGHSLSSVAWGYICGILGAVFFAMKAIFIKLAYRGGEGVIENTLEPITLMVLRMGFALPIYIFILVWALKRQKKKIRKDRVFEYDLKIWLKSMALGMLCYYLCAFLDFTGLQYITAQLERMLLFTYPIFVMILGALFFGRKLSIWSVLAIVLAYSGIGVIFMGGDIAVGENVVFGSVLILGTALFYAIFQLLAVGFIQKLGSEVFTCIAMIGATVAVFIHFIIVNAGDMSPLIDLPLRIYVLGLLLATVSTLIPSFLVNMALGRIGAQPVAILGMFGPIATIIAAITLLGEPFGWLDGFGTLLVIFGIGLYTVFDKNRSQQTR